MAGNFAAPWPTDPKFSALKDLNPFKTVQKIQEASSIIRVGLALSKWPHLHRAYVVSVWFFLNTIVCSAYLLGVCSVLTMSVLKKMRMNISIIDFILLTGYNT